MTFSRCQRPSRKVKLSNASSTSSLNRIDVNVKFIKNYKPSTNVQRMPQEEKEEALKEREAIGKAAEKKANLRNRIPIAIKENGTSVEEMADLTVSSNKVSHRNNTKLKNKLK